MIRPGTTCTIYAFSRTVQSELPSVEPTHAARYTSHELIKQIFKKLKGV